MHILVQEINKRVSFLPFLCDFLLKSLQFVIDYNSRNIPLHI